MRRESASSGEEGRQTKKGRARPYPRRGFLVASWPARPAARAPPSLLEPPSWLSLGPLARATEAGSPSIVGAVLEQSPGNFCRKLAYSSSEGFWELVLQERSNASVGNAPSRHLLLLLPLLLLAGTSGAQDTKIREGGLQRRCRLSHAARCPVRWLAET